MIFTRQSEERERGTRMELVKKSRTRFTSWLNGPASSKSLLTTRLISAGNVTHHDAVIVVSAGVQRRWLLAIFVNTRLCQTKPLAVCTFNRLGLSRQNAQVCSSE